MTVDRTVRHKWIAFGLAALAALGLAWALISHRWFVSHERQYEHFYVGLVSTINESPDYDDRDEIRRVEQSNREFAQHLADRAPSDERTSDAAWFWKAGIAVLVFGLLAVLGLAFIAVITVQWPNATLPVNAKALLALVLLLAAVVSVILIANVPYRPMVHQGASLIVFYGAIMVGFVANEMLGKHRAGGKAPDIDPMVQ
jgi:Flp pilus assembly protein TadB